MDPPSVADGAAPPSERPTLPSDEDLARWYGGQRRDSSDTDHLTDLRAVALGAIELFAAGSDLESLRADRALLARYGAVLALPYLPAHAEAYGEALNAVGTELGERALALAAQGCGR